MAKHSLSDLNGVLERYPDFASHYVVPRNVDVWLPPGYEVDPLVRYPVIYMHDGQNLFDPGTSYAGVDWGMDEAVTGLMLQESCRAAIVVGVWNAGHDTLTLKFPGDEHSEQAWRDRVDEPLKFLLGRG